MNATRKAKVLDLKETLTKLTGEQKQKLLSKGLVATVEGILIHQQARANLLLAGKDKTEWGFLVDSNDDCIKAFRVNLNFRPRFLEFIKEHNIEVTNKKLFAWITEAK